jgi:hypothetical protein
MIEKVKKKTDMDAETDVPTVGDGLELRTKSSSHKHSIAVTSLMEDEDEDEEEGEQGSISRNISLVDDNEDHRDHDSDENERRGPSHLERNTKRKENEDAVSELPAICAPYAVIPMCEGDLPFLSGCRGQTLAEHIDFMTVRFVDLLLSAAYDNS